MSIADLKPMLIYQDETGFHVRRYLERQEIHRLRESRATTTADSDVYLYNTETKEMKNITAHEGDVDNSPQTFDVDSKYLYFLSDEGGEFIYVARYDLATGKREVVEKAQWDVSSTLFFAQRQVSRRRDERRRADQDTGRRTPRPASRSTCRTLPDGDITGVNISDSDTRMAFYHNGSRSPANLYVYDFATKKPVEADQEPQSGDQSRGFRRVARDPLQVVRWDAKFPAILYQAARRQRGE